MLDLQQIQALAQYSDNLEVILKKLEKSYSDNDAENFNKAKQEIVDVKNKISGMINPETKQNDI